jgi:AraC-like DNA-binding protein
MQKQPRYRLHISPVRWPDEFPLLLHQNHVQRDAEITDLHVHDGLELGYCYEGTGIFAVENKVIPFSKGDISIITSSEMHLAQSTHGTTSRWSWIYIDPERLLFPIYQDSRVVDTSPFSGSDFKNIVSAGEDSKLQHLLLELINAAKRKGPFYENEVTSLSCLFLSHLHERVGDRETDERLKYETDTLQRIQKAIVFIANNYHLSVRLKELASLCHLSPNHFRRLFQQAIGKSPIQYLNHVRITMATTELMQDRKQISTIAFECGFNSLSSFNRQFKAQTGVSPREYRGR